MKARLAIGHGDGGQAVENWDLSVLAGAGALRSTAKDMLAFAAANLGLAKSDLYDTMKSQQMPLARVARRIRGWDWDGIPSRFTGRKL